MSKVKTRCKHHSFKYLGWRIEKHIPEVEVMASSPLSQSFPTCSPPEHTWWVTFIGTTREAEARIMWTSLPPAGTECLSLPLTKPKQKHKEIQVTGGNVIKSDKSSQ